MKTKLFNNSQKIAYTIIDAWLNSNDDERVKGEKVKHYYDALTRYSCPANEKDIDQTWKKILDSLKKNEFNQVKQLIKTLMTCELPIVVSKALEESYLYDRNDDSVLKELAVKDSDAMFDKALRYDGEFCLIVDRAIKINKNILKIEASEWSVSIGEYETKSTPFPPYVQTHWVLMIERTYLYLIKEKRLIEI